MAKYYYKRGAKFSLRFFRVLSLIILICGLGIIIYIFMPLISWQIYFAPAFANQINSPIPKTTIVSQGSFASLISQAQNSISGIDYTNAQNWFPEFNTNGTNAPRVKNYNLSIPKLKIEDANVSTVDTNLAIHLVNYPGTAVPPDRGNAVVFGHSTLPQLFDPGNYKTIFATLYKLKTDDEILVKIDNMTFKYRIFNISVVDANNTSLFEQNFNESFLTLVTCTPPGTTWKRLVIKARMEKI